MGGLRVSCDGGGVRETWRGVIRQSDGGGERLHDTLVQDVDHHTTAQVRDVPLGGEIWTRAVREVVRRIGCAPYAAPRLPEAHTQR